MNPDRGAADNTGVSPLLLRRLSDELLGSRLAKGEAAAFDELYRRYAHRLAAYAGHLLGDAAAGEDVAQSTLMKAYGAMRQGPPPSQVRAWLYRIAHNTAIDTALRRRESPTETVPERVQPEAETSAGMLVAALVSLPDRQREAYVLRELHGFRVDEIADELSLTSPQVEQALFAARNRLAEQLTFGERLDCVTVRRLLSGPLDSEERRALKPHLRSCPACRSEAGLRGRIAGLLTPVEWLRTPLSGIAGGAPVAAKATALVATATVAAAVPVATLDTGHPHAKPSATRRAALAAATPEPPHPKKPHPPATPMVAVLPVLHPSNRLTPLADKPPGSADPAHTGPTSRSSGDGQRDGGTDTADTRTSSPSTSAVITTPGDGPGTPGRDSNSDSSSSIDGAQPTTPAPAPTTPTVTTPPQTATTNPDGPGGGSGGSTDGSGSDGVTGATPDGGSSGD